MENSCKSVFPNTRAWEHHELNKIKKQTKKASMGGRKKEVPTAYHILIKIQQLQHNRVIFKKIV